VASAAICTFTCKVDHTASMMMKVQDHSMLIVPLAVGSGIQLGSTSVAFSGASDPGGELVTASGIATACRASVGTVTKK
jgi:hypothetical protein